MFDKSLSEITYKDINDLLYLKQEREGQRLDYKKEFHKEGKEFAKDVTAFANSEGGYIIFGIDEKENIVCGINDMVGNIKIDDWISNTLNSNASEIIKYELRFISISDEENPSYLLILLISESINKPVYVTADQKSICYIRKGSSTFSAKPNDIKQMYKKSSKNKEQVQIKVTQKSNGNNNLQIGVNQGTVIKTERVTKKNEVIINPKIHITQEQAKQIYDSVNEIVEINEKAGKFKTSADKGMFFAQTWTSFKNRFNVTSYHLLPKEKFNEALSWLKKQIAYKHRPKLRKVNNAEWKKAVYGAIYAKAQNELRMDKLALYEFASEKLKLKFPITSLKELSDARLKKLYQIMFSN